MDSAVNCDVDSISNNNHSETSELNEAFQSNLSLVVDASDAFSPVTEDAVVQSVTANNASLSWRFAIEDPLDKHDLGSVIYDRKGQMLVMTELRRAYNLLNHADANDSVMDQLCEPNTNIPIIPYLCRHCHSNQHGSIDCPIFACNICGKCGHFARDCPYSRANRSTKPPNASRNGNGGDRNRERDKNKKLWQPGDQNKKTGKRPTGSGNEGGNPKTTNNAFENGNQKHGNNSKKSAANKHNNSKN